MLICVIFFLYILDTFAVDGFRLHQDSGPLIEVVSSLLTISFMGGNSSGW